MSRSLPRAVLVWLLALVACTVVILRSEFTADMSAFLPRSPTAEQQLLVDQLKEGVLSRTLLVGIEGGEASGRTRLSRDLATRLRQGGRFTAVGNGEAAAADRDREILFGHRYLLSPAVTPERFSIAGLQQAVADSIDGLASPAGLMLKQLLPRDPTGEMLALLATLEGSGGPARRDGAWVSGDGQRALLLLQTRAAGSDTDAQEATLGHIRGEFAAAAGAAGLSGHRLVMSGAPVFAVDARATIKAEVTRLSILSALAIVCLLLLVYRSVKALAAGLLPVLSGVLAGIAAVSLGFGSVHGITIGFGTTLIGEAVDYSIYYFVQARGGPDSQANWLRRFWPTIRLGVLTSICGFASLLFSGFPGLAQLGLYSIAGLLAAAAVTRHVLPHLTPAGFQVRCIGAIGLRLGTLVDRLAAGRWLVLPLALAAALVLAGQHRQLWNTGLSGLSPVPAEAQALDQSLRADLGAPDMRYLAVATAPDREAALAAAERIGVRLQALVDAGEIAGFESPARFLPSQATQAARRAALPAPEDLRQRLTAALADLPLRPQRLQGFIDDVAAARQATLLTQRDLEGSSLALAVDSLLLERPGGWTALLPLRAAPERNLEISPAPIRRALDEAGQPGALFIDLLAESNRLYANYLDEALLLSLAGFLAIVLLLGASLRSVARLLRVLAPLVASVLVVVATLALAGERLTLLHLVGMLLLVAVGSNYALFFDRRMPDQARAGGLAPETLASLFLANLTTVIGFGILAFSQVPVLRAIGITVGPGAVLALLFSAMLAPRRQT
jgi:predicted exporter